MSSSTLFSRFLSVAALILTLALVGCGGGSGSSLSGGGGVAGTDCTRPTTSDLGGCTYVALSDDTGDFLTYRVKVTKLTLTRRDGTVTSLMPGPATVDFAQYTSLGEFLSLNALPAGDYVSGVIGLDFSGADIEAQDSSGNALTLKPVDTSGKALGAADVTITFDSSHPLSLFPGEAHVLGVNFDLNASNVIHTGNNTVTVQPFLVASVDAPSGTAEQVRGPLASVGSNNFTLSVHPFEAANGDFGDFVVYVTAATGYVVDQKVYIGAAGLTALNAATQNTAVIAQGEFDFSSRHFIATQVLAGSSVPGGSSSAVEGVVTARSGNSLTVRGASLYRSSGSVSFRDTATVNVGTGTTVRSSGLILCDNPPVSCTGKLQTSRTIDAISVGQHILAFGSFGSTSSATLDATHGFALLRATAVDGSVQSLVNAATNSSVTLNVDQIENRPVALFDFTGTNSDPTNYQVDVPCSCLNTGVNVGDPVTVFGLPSAFGTAPPDFNAKALRDFSLGGSVVSFAWAAPTANAFSAIDATSGVVANLSSSPATATLREGGQVTDLTGGGTAPAVVGKSLGVYAISKGGAVQLYLNFSNFVSALHSDLSSGARVSGFFAVGGFDAADDLLNATTISVILR